VRRQPAGDFGVKWLDDHVFGVNHIKQRQQTDFYEAKRQKYALGAALVVQPKTSKAEPNPERLVR
jgi:hypothetical protein